MGEVQGKHLPWDASKWKLIGLQGNHRLQGMLDAVRLFPGPRSVACRARGGALHILAGLYWINKGRWKREIMSGEPPPGPVQVEGEH